VLAEATISNDHPNFYTLCSHRSRHPF
jgi:hypothetical protein